jgi:hypothetical protein
MDSSSCFVWGTYNHETPIKAIKKRAFVIFLLTPVRGHPIGGTDQKQKCRMASFSPDPHSRFF